MVLPKIGLAPSALSEKFIIARPPVSQAASITESCKSFFGLYFVVIVLLLYWLRLKKFLGVRASNRGKCASRFSSAL